MLVDRRSLAIGLGSTAMLTASRAMASKAQPQKPAQAAVTTLAEDLKIATWDEVRALFPLDPAQIHMGGLLFSSHAKPVAAAIERFRRELDTNPVAAIHDHFASGEEAARASLATYFGVDAKDLALTDSTTMGLGLLYGGLKLAPGDEVLTTEHDHDATYQALNLACERSGAKLNKVRLYEKGSTFSVAQAQDRLSAAITPQTRVVAVTWVHSSTGVRLPLRQLAEVIEHANTKQGRDEANRVLLCVDGVHGTGVENVSLPDLGCDFFVAGTHKWLFGPRGTGILWARASAQSRIVPTIPTFSLYFVKEPTWGRRMTPGGFHTYEHRWAVGTAVDMHLAIGKARVESRIHALNTRMKTGLAEIKGLTLHTPMDASLSSGIVCFELPDRKPDAIIQELASRRIIATTTPYAVSYARVTPGLLNDEAEVDATIKAISALATHA